jgi:membrane protease YdiL (CAAX protease family)
VADDSIETSPESPIQRFEKVASPAHTLFLLLVLAVVAVLGYFSTHRPGAVHGANRLFFYLATMAWEWLLVAYIYGGLRRRGKSIRNTLSVTAGICEETIFRGYLRRQLAWTRSAPIGVLLSAALFDAGHVYQGARATVAIGLYGLMFAILAEARRNLRPGIMTHA